MKGPLWQISIGLWLSMAIALGIMGRSLSTFGWILAIGAFFVGGGLAGEAARSERKPLRMFGKIASVFFALIIVGAVLNTLERVYLVNAETYPRFLARDMGAADMKAIDMLRAKECKGEPVEIYPKQDETWVMRCGFSWFNGHTYISSVDPFVESKERAQ